VVTQSSIDLPGLPTLTWTGAPSSASVDPDRGGLVMTAAAGTDWINHAQTGVRNASASALGFTADGDFALSAQVTVAFGSTFDAGALCLFSSQESWAKLCLERSPQGQAMVVSVVTNGGYSDDCNSAVVDGDSVYLRVSRSGRAYAFHSSTDGQQWSFVRLFRLTARAGHVKVGFLAQTPLGEACSATFSEIQLTDRAPADLRDGS